MRAAHVALVLLVGAMSCTETASENGSLDGAVLIRASEIGDAYPSALGQGTLVVSNGCLAMRTGSQAPGFVLWPPNFDLQRGPSGVEVVDGQGNLVAGVGEPVQLGGGWMHLSAALGLTDDRVPEACRVDGERYFIASPGIGWELDGVTLLRSRSESLSGDQALAEGRLGERNGCVALLDDAGNGPYLVWPRLFILTDGPTGFFVRNAEDDRIFASAGETLHIGGSIGSIDDPRALPGGIPDACQDRGSEYWFVGERLPSR